MFIILWVISLSSALLGCISVPSGIDGVHAHVYRHRGADDLTLMSGGWLPVGKDNGDNWVMSHLPSNRPWWPGSPRSGHSFLHGSKNDGFPNTWIHFQRLSSFTFANVPLTKASYTLSPQSAWGKISPKRAYEEEVIIYHRDTFPKW